MRQAIEKKTKNGCQLNDVGNIDLIFHMCILGAQVHVCTRYEVPVIKSLIQEDCPQTPDNDNGNIRRVIHDYIEINFSS